MPDTMFSEIFNERQLLKQLLDVSREQLSVLQDIRTSVQEILFLITPQPLTTSIAVQFTGATMQPNNTLVFNVGDTSQASIVSLGIDGTPDNGVVSNVIYTFNDPSATVVLNADGLTATCTGVADSGGVAVSGSASCTVTDTDGVVSQWTQAFTIQTIGVPPQQITQSVAVQFTDPVSSGGPVTQAALKVPVGQRAPAVKK